MNFRRTLLLAAFPFFTIACSSMSQLAQKPKTELKRVYARDTSLSGTTAVFVLEIENPNKIPIKLDKVDYELFLDNRAFSQATVDKDLELPAEGKKTIEIPLPVLFSKLGEGLGKVVTGQDLDYRIAGHAHLSVLSLPFEKSGKLKLKDLGKK